MKEQPLVLTFDIGTQSTRAMLVDKQGNILGIKKKEYEEPYYSLNPDWAEQKPSIYWDAMCECSQSLRAEMGEVWNDIVAVSCTSIRDTVLTVDEQGVPTRDVILWLDKRKSSNLPPLPKTNAFIFGALKLLPTINHLRTTSACNWIQHSEPEVWRRSHKLLLISSYFTFLFTGKFVDSSANIVGHVPYDVKTRSWMKPNDMRRCIFDVPDHMLCDLVEPGTVVGPLTAEACRLTGVPEGTPYVATGPDKGCETLGLGCIDEDSAALSFGTTATIEVTSNQYFEAVPVVPPYPAVVGKFNAEVEIFRGYWLVSWFKREFAASEMALAEQQGISAEHLLSMRLPEIPAGSEGLMFQPYFTPDAVMPHAKGAIIGFSDIHTRIHVYRAIIEGINYALMEGLETIEKKGKIKIKHLLVAGGGSRSGEICQITANMFGLPVSRIQTHEVSGIGSAMVAFTGMHVFADYEEAKKSMVHIVETFQPNEKEHAVYRTLYADVFKKLFGNLAPSYQKIGEVLAGKLS